MWRVFPWPSSNVSRSGQPRSRESSRHHQLACASLQTGPEGHHEVVPGGMIAELKCCLPGTVMPIQVVRDLPGRAHCTMCEDKWSWPRRFCSQCHVTRWVLAAPSWSLWWCFPGTVPGWRYWAVWRPWSCQKCMQDLPSQGAMKTEQPDAAVHSITAGVWQNHRWSRPGHFPRSWNCWNSPLNQVLCGVPMPAVVQDGIHVKVVRWHVLLDFQAVEGSLGRFTGSIGHHVGQGAGVPHGLHTKDLLGPAALVALGQLTAGLAPLDQVHGQEVQMTQAYHPPREAVNTGAPRRTPHWTLSPYEAPCQWCCDVWSCRCATRPGRTSTKHRVLMAVMWQCIMPCMVLWKHSTTAQFDVHSRWLRTACT